MPRLVRAPSLRRWLCAGVSGLLLGAAAAAGAAVSDDFGDGNDTTPPWSHFAPTVGATFNAASLSYLISVPATGNPANHARATSLRQDASFGDTVVAADLVAFDAIASHQYGVVARRTSAAGPTHDGYAFVIRAPGQIALLQITNQVVTTLATRSVSVSGAVDYRLVLSVTGTGPAVLKGTLYATSDLTTPLATVTHSDSVAPIYGTGFSGVVVEDVGALQNQTLSASFDRFFASAPNADTDADGLADGAELSIGTDPSDADTDDDGLLDGAEVATGNFSALPASTTPFSTYASGVSAADVDGDGDTDLIVAKYEYDQVVWYENDGTPAVGGWTERLVSAVADGPRSVAAGDVDGDGDTDLLSTSQPGNTVTWHENDGTPAVGTWTSYTVTTAAVSPFDIVAADVDRDGDLDAIVAEFDGPSLSWYENDGTPAVGLWTERVISTAANGLRTISAADVDRDGDVDVFSAETFGGGIGWYENDGTPGNGAWTRFAVGNTGQAVPSLAAGDVDGDGDTDLFCASSASTELIWFENDGTPATGLWLDRPISNVTDYAIQVFGVDVDGDGDQDALSTAYGGRVDWHENDGTPALGAWSEHVIASSGTESIFPADVDGDGVVDVVAARYADSGLFWHPQQNLADPLDSDTDGDGLGDAAEVNTYGSNPNASDTDGDGLGDGAEVNTHGTSPTSPDTDGDGLSDGAEVNSYGTSPIAADTDGDALLDSFEVTYGFNPLVGGQQGQDPDGDGLTNLQEQSAATNPLQADSDGDGLGDGAEVNTHGTDPNASDTDGDGLGDGAEVNTHGTNPNLADSDSDGLSDSQELNLYGTNPNLADTDGDGLLDGQEAPGNGTFAEPRGIESAGSVSVSAADFDGDGDLDVLSTGSAISWSENDGTAEVGLSIAHPIANHASTRFTAIAVDMDGDGDADVLSGCYSDDTIAWHENDGTPAGGPWAEHVISTGADGAVSVAAADFDGDGDLDAVAASSLGRTVAWYENDGTPAVGAWTARAIWSTPTNPRSIYTADMDGDGDSDVITLLSTENMNVSWAENDGTPSVGAWELHPLVHSPIPTPSGNTTQAIFPTDINGDGATDLVSQFLYAFGDPYQGISWNGGLIDTVISTDSTQPFAIDVDGDGDMDVLGTSNYVGAWFENVDTSGTSWSKHPISGAWPIHFAADLDGDGDPDLLAGSLSWLEQLNLADALDPDTDDDGLGDGAEVNTHGTNPLAVDTDGDGLDDPTELFTHGTNPTAADTDGDGLLDGFEVANGFDPLAAGQQGQDPDGDGLTNLAEQDAGTNPHVADSDGDGLNDGAEFNTYGTDPNAPDTDGDGLLDGAEVNTHGTDPSLSDTEGDGLHDGFEVQYGFNPLVGGEQSQDPDGDDLTNFNEQDFGTNPIRADTDGDRLDDGAELNEAGTNPLVTDTDTDGMGDGFEFVNGFDPLFLDQDFDLVPDGQADWDNDGLSNAEEELVWANPDNPDTDFDGDLDGADNCPVTANPTQSDVGGLLGAPPDGIGDACQCGDVDDSGIVDHADTDVYRDSLADPTGLALTPAGVEKCSVIDSAGPCEILDVTVIQRALEAPPLAPGIAQVCGAAVAP